MTFDQWWQLHGHENAGWKYDYDLCEAAFEFARAHENNACAQLAEEVYREEKRHADSHAATARIIAERILLRREDAAVVDARVGKIKEKAFDEWFAQNHDEHGLLASEYEAAKIAWYAARAQTEQACASMAREMADDEEYTKSHRYLARIIAEQIERKAG